MFSFMLVEDGLGNLALLDFIIVPFVP